MKRNVVLCSVSLAAMYCEVCLLYSNFSKGLRVLWLQIYYYLYQKHHLKYLVFFFILCSSKVTPTARSHRAMVKAHTLANMYTKTNRNFDRVPAD